MLSIWDKWNKSWLWNLEYYRILGSCKKKDKNIIYLMKWNVLHNIVSERKEALNGGYRILTFV